MRKIVSLGIILIGIVCHAYGQIYTSSSARITQTGGLYEQLYGAKMVSVNRPLVNTRERSNSVTNRQIETPKIQVSSTSRTIENLNEIQRSCARMSIRARDIQEGLCLTDTDAEEVAAELDTYSQSGPHKMPPPTEAPIGEMPWIMMAMMMAGYALKRYWEGQSERNRKV